jgi:uncharacterized protein (DUF302 family)
MASLQPHASEGIVTKPSPRSVADTVTRLQQLIEERGLTLFAIIDHSGAAERAGLAMPDTKLVVFGSPTAGTPVMVAVPVVGLDLPLKILVWEDATGSVSVSYSSAAFIAERHQLSPEMEARFQPIEAISAAAVALDA